MLIIKRMPALELFYWAVSSATFIFEWIYRVRVSAFEGKCLFVMLFALLFLWMNTMAKNSGFHQLVDAVKGKNRSRELITFSNIYMVFEGIEAGIISVSEENLNKLKSLRRSMYYGTIPIILCLMTFAALSSTSR
ncbi:MAG: hypothetical protein IJM17_06470 [Firmicutes bacterium]|nr:hypothetical protein [Bacillota bacterium]